MMRHTYELVEFDHESEADKVVRIFAVPVYAVDHEAYAEQHAYDYATLYGLPDADVGTRYLGVRA